MQFNSSQGHIINNVDAFQLRQTIVFVNEAYFWNEVDLLSVQGGLREERVSWQNSVSLPLNVVNILQFCLSKL